LPGGLRHRQILDSTRAVHTDGRILPVKPRRLGRSGLWISQLAPGTMDFGNPTDKAESFRIVDAAIDPQINPFDIRR
jgi:hypothetical protein